MDTRGDRGRRRAGAAALGLVLAVSIASLGACSSEGSNSSPPGTAGASATPTTAPFAIRDSQYVLPDPLPTAEPGTVISSEQQPESARIPDATFTRFTYHSQDHTGRDVPVGGALFVPTRRAPKGGWPVASWGHGTTGVADVCAPSLTDNLFYNEYAQEASSLLQAGYAVVATDYPGLGTPDPHGYLVGEDEGNALVDAVVAARALDPSLAADWFAIGHSQGGQAALFATRSAERAPSLTLRGAVAIAPASGLEAALPAITAGSVPADLVYGTYAIAGLATVDPTIELRDELGPAGLANYDLITEEGCLLDTLPKLGAVEVADIFDLSTERATELSARVGRYGDPEREATVGPVLVVQGETDRDVPLGLTERMVTVLQEKGSDVELRRYPGRDHDRVLGPSMCDVLAWMTDHGGAPAGTCTPSETDMS